MGPIEDLSVIANDFYYFTVNIGEANDFLVTKDIFVNFCRNCKNCFDQSLDDVFCENTVNICHGSF